MFVAYKYLNLDNGLLVVFENRLPVCPNISISVKKMDNDCYLALDENYLIPLKNDIVEHLTKTKKIYIVYSDIFNIKMDPQGVIEINDILMGKLLAYMEMELSV